MKRSVSVLAVVVLLSACGSAVKLDSVPVEDKSGSAVSNMATQSNASGNGTANGGVASVDLSKINPDSIMQSTNRVVYFDYDSFAIRPEFQSVIEAHAKFLKSDKARKVMIEGHTDERGGREYNLALGQRRAEAVRRMLTLIGVSDAQVETISFGKEKPKALGDTEADYAENRRADFNYKR